jgi:SAM-dependent methyltransferase
MDVFTRPQRVLHVAPEPAIGRHIGAVSGGGYVTLDLAVAGVDVRGDVTCLPFPTTAFDTIICTHVLEHVPDDVAAMSELRRVLAPGGKAVLQVPFDPTRSETFEDFSATTPETRLRLFGQDDHVRIYATDYTDRLRGAGFTVTIDNYVLSLDADTKQRFGLRDEAMVIATR